MEVNQKLLNDVKNRFLFIPPSVAAGLEREPQITDFEMMSQLGSGSFGKVSLCKHKITNAIYAIKEIDKTNKSMEAGKPYFRREVEIMYKINHPNIVKLFGHFEDNKSCYFIMEYIPKGNLYSLLTKQKNKTFDKIRVASFMRDLVSALYYIHNMDPPIIHRDIKPENILVTDDGKIKLTDFGWSNYIKYTEIRSTFCGTPLYLAPEVINNTGHDSSVDIWCVGALIFELLTGNCPFNGKTETELFGNILKNKIDWPRDINIEAKNLISRILKTDSKDRYTLQEMLKHPFFTNNVENPEEFMFKPSDVKISEEMQTYIISKDSPQSLFKNLNIKKSENNTLIKDMNNFQINPISQPVSIITNPTTNLNYTGNINNINGNSNFNSNYINGNNIENTLSGATNLQNLNKSQIDDLIKNPLDLDKNMLNEYKKIQNQLFEATEKNKNLHKENEELKLKQKMFSLEKESLIKEKEDQENAKLDLQREIAQLQYKNFEYEEKLKSLIIIVKANEQQTEKDRNHINSLYNEIQQSNKSKDEISMFYQKKIDQLEEMLKEATSKKQNQIQNDISFFRESMQGFFDNNQKPVGNKTANNNNNFELDFMRTLDMLKNDFDEERKKYLLIIKTKEEEINRLHLEINANNQNEIMKQKNLIDKLNHDLSMKQNDINLLTAKVGILEEMLNNLRSKKY